MKKRLLSVLAGCMFLTYSYGQNEKEWYDQLYDADANYFEVVKKADKYFETHGKGKGSGWKVYNRFKDDIKFKIDENGHLLDPKRIESEMKKYRKSTARMAAGSSSTWSELGPSTLRDAGRVTAIAIDPNNSNIIFVTSPGGGCWKTTNGGASWSTTTDQIESMNAYDVTIDPQNSNNVFIGTYAAGILKSTNGGSTWSKIGGNAFASDVTVYKISFFPGNSNIVFAAASNGLYRSNDGGNTWTRLLEEKIEDIEFKPGNASVMYICGDNFFKSTNSGASFSQVSTGILSTERMMVAVTPASPESVYLVQKKGNEFGYLYYSSNSGDSFTLRLEGPNTINIFGQQGWYNMAIAVSPTNVNEVYVGGIELWKSTNGGTSFSVTPPTTHADFHALEYSGSTLFAGNDGGIYKSNDNGATWINLCSNLAIRQLYRLSNSVSDAEVIAIGSQDNGSSIRKATGWIDYFGADGMEQIVDYTNSDVIYGTWQSGGIYKTIDGGRSTANMGYPTSGRGEWITPWVMDPTDNNTLYLGYTEIQKTTNGGQTWAPISNFTSLWPGVDAGLAALAVAPSNSNYIYAAKWSWDKWESKVWRTKNGGTTWEEVSSGVSGGIITYLTVHPEDPEKVAMSVAHYGTTAVYNSNNAGDTWDNISGNLPNIGAHCILYQGGPQDALYVGLERGIYYTDKSISSSLTSWVPFMNGLPNVMVRELEIHYPTQKIRAATYGRGVWEAPLYSTSFNVAPTITITAPSNGSSVDVNSTVQITANASDIDGTVKHVNFYANSVLIGSDNTSPYTVNWTIPSLGNYTISAVVFDNFNNKNTSYVNVTGGGSGCNDPAYVAGTSYNANDVVQNVNAQNQIRRYRCNVAGWCGVSPWAYEPGKGAHWQMAWSEIGECQTVNDNPVVTITSPSSSFRYNPGSSLTVSANVANNVGTITKVEISSPHIENSMVTLTSAPFTANFNNLPSSGMRGATSFLVKAYDDQGGIGGASIDVPENKQPSVSITNPSNGSTVDAPVVIQASASDIDGTISKVDFYTSAGQLIITDYDAPYTATWNAASAGTNTIYAIATDNDGGTGTSTSITFTVNNVQNDVPVVTIISPASTFKYNYQGSLTVSATVSNNIGTITKVEIYSPHIENSLQTITQAPYTATFESLPSSGMRGATSFVVKAYDNLGAIGGASIDVVENRQPVVSITSPSNNATVMGPNVVLEATASDQENNGLVVEFFRGGQFGYKIGEDNSAPYSVIWPNVAPGTYTYYARATDPDGGIGYTTTYVVTVQGSTCSAPQYVENGGYAAGSQVKNGGVLYECKPWPYSGWCNGQAWAYAPGTGLYWQDAWISKGSCARVGSTEETNSILVMPNPTAGSVELSGLSTADDYQFFILDVYGKDVLSGRVTNSSNSIDLSGFAPGLYTLKIQVGDQVIMKKVVKQ